MSEPEWSLPHVEPFPWAHHEAAEKPDLEVEKPESTATEIREHVDKALTYIHGGADAIVVGESITGMFGHPHAIAALAANAEIVGLLALTVGVPLIMYDTFTTGLRVYEQKGFCYGVMWGALGPESEPKTTAYLNNITDEGERKAFKEGIEEGKKAVQEKPELKDAVRSTVVYEYTRQTYQSVTTPEGRSLNRIWEQVHDKDSVWRGTAAGVRNTGLEWESPGTMYGKEQEDRLDHLKPEPKH